MTPAAHKILHSSKSNEWYTSQRSCDLVRAVFGGYIDLDPASNYIANMTVRARYWFDIWDNGLAQRWDADNVFLNPPYGKDFETNKSNAQIWTRKMINEYEAGHFQEGIMLLNATPDRSWFRSLWDYWVCFLDKREKFWRPSGEPNSPTQGNVLIYFGETPEAFIEHASQIGTVIDPDHVYSKLRSVA